MVRFCIFTQAAIAVAAMVMLIAEVGLFIVSPAHARIACHAAKPFDARDWWSWREVKGQRCWYPGRSGMNKAVLYWPATPGRQSQAMPAPAVSLPAQAMPFAERWPR